MFRFIRRPAVIACLLTAAMIPSAVVPAVRADERESCPEPVGVPIDSTAYGADLPPNPASTEAYRHWQRQRQLARRLALLQARLAGRPSAPPEPLSVDPLTGNPRSQPPVAHTGFNSLGSLPAVPLTAESKSPATQPVAVWPANPAPPATEAQRRSAVVEKTAAASPEVEKAPASIQKPAPATASTADKKPTVSNAPSKIWEVKRTGFSSPVAGMTEAVSNANVVRTSSSTLQPVSTTVEGKPSAAARPTQRNLPAAPAQKTVAKRPSTSSTWNAFKPATENRATTSTLSSKYEVGGKWGSGGK